MHIVLKFLIASVGAAFVQQLDLPALAKRVQPSVITVLTYDEAGKPLGQGSGFFIGADGRFVTNIHVLADARRAEIKTHDGRTFEVRSVLLADSLASDVAIASLRSATYESIFRDEGEREGGVLPVFQPLKLSGSVPQVGQDVLVVGSPLGLEQTVSTGIVSGIRSGNGTNAQLQISAPISPGSSGSPVLDTKGEVLGVATLQVREGQSLNFAVPSSRLTNLSGPPRDFKDWIAHERTTRIEAARQHFIKADKLGAGPLGAHRCSEAIPDYEEALRLVPNHDVMWWSALGRCFDELQEYERAIEVYRRGTTYVFADQFVLRVNLGGLFGRLGRHREALLEFQKAFALVAPTKGELQPKTLAVVLSAMLGEAYAKLEMFPEAIASYRRALEAEPRNASYLGDLGKVYSDLGRFEEALRMFREQVRELPSSSIAHYNLGTTYLRLGRLREAESSFREAAALDPQHAQNHVNLGIAYLRLGDRTAALNQYKILQQLNQDLADVLFEAIYR